MRKISEEIANLVDILPETDQEFTLEFVKKMVRAWDPDFTKLTKSEAAELADAEQSGFVSANDIDWDTIGI